MTTDTQATHHGPQNEHHDMGHAIPAPVLIAVFLALIVLTVITVVASYLPLGEFEIWVAMGIATVKASLVAAYFMHLRYDNPLNAILFIFCLLFVALFIGFVLMDADQYRSDLIMKESTNSRPGYRSFTPMPFALHLSDWTSPCPKVACPRVSPCCRTALEDQLTPRQMPTDA